MQQYDRLAYTPIFYVKFGFIFGAHEIHSQIPSARDNGTDEHFAGGVSEVNVNSHKATVRASAYR